MNASEVFLRETLRRWERRFRDDSGLSASVVIATQNEFCRQYGLKRLHEIKNQVYLEVASEQKGGASEM